MPHKTDPSATPVDSFQRTQRLNALSNPDIDMALRMSGDLEYLEAEGHWKCGVPAWCREWSDLIGTSPAVIVSGMAWRAVARALREEYLSLSQERDSLATDLAMHECPTD